MQMFLLFSHQLTEEQEREARTQFGVTTFCHLPAALKQIWSTIPPDGAWDTCQLRPIQEWLQSRGRAHDVVLVQGEYGATVYMVAWLRKEGFRPVYATSQRDVDETIRSDGTIETKRRIRHVQFREYPQV